MKLLVTILLSMSCGFTYLKLDRMISAQEEAELGSLELSDLRIEIGELDSLDKFAAISKYPLFDPNRRPPVQKVEVVDKKISAVPRLQVQALGIAIVDEITLALVRNLRTGEIRRMKFNEEIDGWILTEVTEDRFVFEKQGAKREAIFKPKGS